MTRLLEKKAGDRYADAVELLEDLDSLRTSKRDGVRDEGLPFPSKRRRHRLVLSLMALAIVSLVVTLVIRARVGRDPAGSPGPLHETPSSKPSVAIAESGDRSIAVLPFVNLSGDPSQEYFSDGVAEELLNLLARIPELRVVSRSSAFAFKEDNPGIPEIARRLDVARVLEGSVRIVGDRVRISVQLIDARTDSQLWSETFDGVLDDIFAVQDAIASQVVDRLQVSLLPEEKGSRTADPQAYTLYLQAMHLLRQSTEASHDSALDLLDQALERDPDYLDAWVLRSTIYSNQVGLGLAPFTEGYRLAEEAVQEALRLDPHHAKARCQLASIAFERDHDMTRCAHELAQVEGVATDATCLTTASRLLAAVGRIESSLRISEHLQDRDPVNPVTFVNLGYDAYLAGHLDEAISATQRARTLSPEMAGTGALLALAYSSRAAPGDLQRALEAMRQEPIEGFRLQVEAIVHYLNGDRVASDAALLQLIESHAEGWPYNIASVFAVRGEVDLAFEWLDRAMAYGDTGMSTLRSDPLLRPLSADPRWERVLEQMGMADSQLSAIEDDLETTIRRTGLE